MRIIEVISFLESWAPPSYQESYDNSGLLTGDTDWEVTGVLCALDCIESVIDEAIEKKCNLVIAHHPIIFSGLKQIRGKNYIERTIIKAIKKDVAIYSIHTNLDNVRTGVNDKIADKIGIKNRQILIPKTDVLSKLEVYCPDDEVDKLRHSLFEAGVGNFSNYSNCSFIIQGEGTFKPNENANPSIGKKGEEHRGRESKVEVVFPTYLKYDVIATMKKNHSYEEVAYQVFNLKNENQNVGSGLFGELDNEMRSLEFLQYLKERMELKMIRHTKLVHDRIRKVSIVGGSGSFALPYAIRHGADILISADFKYHQFFDAEDDIIIADIGHYESEQFTSQLLVDRLTENFPNFAVLLTDINTNPVQYL